MCAIIAPAFRESTCSLIWSFRAIGTAGNLTSPNCHPGQALSIISGLSIVGILGSVSTGNISVTTSLVNANGTYLGRPASTVSFSMTISSSDETNETDETVIEKQDKAQTSDRNLFFKSASQKPKTR